MTRHRFCHSDSVDYWPGEITFGSEVVAKVALGGTVSPSCRPEIDAAGDSGQYDGVT